MVLQSGGAGSRTINCVSSDHQWSRGLARENADLGWKSAPGLGPSRTRIDPPRPISAEQPADNASFSAESPWPLARPLRKRRLTCREGRAYKSPVVTKTPRKKIVAVTEPASATGEDALFARVVDIIEAARRHVARSVNTAMVKAYWFIGREKIVEVEQHGRKRARYGEHVVEGLAKRLAARVGKGFSVPNLRNMRQFYLTYREGSALPEALASAANRSALPSGSASKKIRSAVPLANRAARRHFRRISAGPTT